MLWLAGGEVGVEEVGAGAEECEGGDEGFADGAHCLPLREEGGGGGGGGGREVAGDVHVGGEEEAAYVKSVC